MSAHPDAILDGIAMVLAADGEVGEREVELAVEATRALPGLAAVRDDVTAALGAAFERFVDEGTDARTRALVAHSIDQESRLEVLLAAAVAARADGPFTDGELACIRAIGRAMGAEDAEIESVVALPQAK